MHVYPTLCTDKLNLLGMLWYHGPKSQREAESSLDSCRSSGECCYIVREHKGSFFLSIRYRGMHYHLPIEQSKNGFVLKDHYNVFASLQELITHHQKHSIYVDSGEFVLQTSCHKGTIKRKHMAVN